MARNSQPPLHSANLYYVCQRRASELQVLGVVSWNQHEIVTDGMPCRIAASHGCSLSQGSLHCFRMLSGSVPVCLYVELVSSHGATHPPWNRSHRGSRDHSDSPSLRRHRTLGPLLSPTMSPCNIPTGLSSHGLMFSCCSISRIQIIFTES